MTRLSLNTLHQKRNQENLSQALHHQKKLGRKTASPSVEYDDFGKEFIGELEKELDMELDKSDDVRKRRPKGDAVDYTPLSDDERWEKAKNKPGNESLEPRRISVPLPGSEAQETER